MASYQARIETVSRTPGLAAFWCFDGSPCNDVMSCCDKDLNLHAIPFFLGRVGDRDIYPVSQWPYTDAKGRLLFTDDGHFGRSIHLNQGHIFGIVPRRYFEGTPIDIFGRQPCTMIAWVRFTGERHLIGGIWDEGGWNRYGGRRQVALFGGLFGQSGGIAHISATGAACYPQSTAEGAEFARTRAIDGASIETGEWTALAMTFDPATSEVRVYKNGVATPMALTDPVMADAIGITEHMPANPIYFKHKIFCPNATLLKFSGFDYKNSPIREHQLDVDFKFGLIEYKLIGDLSPLRYRVRGRVETQTISRFEVDSTKPRATFQTSEAGREGKLVASLEIERGQGWVKAADDVTYSIPEGAPFTFARAPGIGEHGRDFGSQIDLSGFAVFNRVLSPAELSRMAFL